MKNNENWVEALVDKVSSHRYWFTSLVLILVVLFVGAGSLYMLLNTEG